MTNLKENRRFFITVNLFDGGEVSEFVNTRAEAVQFVQTKAEAGLSPASGQIFQDQKVDGRWLPVGDYCVVVTV